MLVPAFLTHACLGAPYGWSAVTAALTREHGGPDGNSGVWFQTFHVGPKNNKNTQSIQKILV